MWLRISMSVSSSIRRLKDCPVVIGLHELGPVGGRATGGRDGRQFERFAEVREDLPDRTWIGDECDQPDVTPHPRAFKWKLLAQPGDELGPGNP
jgi:hypothetical protein